MGQHWELLEDGVAEVSVGIQEICLKGKSGPDEKEIFEHCGKEGGIRGYPFHYKAQ